MSKFQPLTFSHASGIKQTPNQPFCNKMVLVLCAIQVLELWLGETTWNQDLVFQKIWEATDPFISQWVITSAFPALVAWFSTPTTPPLHDSYNISLLQQSIAPALCFHPATLSQTPHKLTMCPWKQRWLPSYFHRLSVRLLFVTLSLSQLHWKPRLLSAPLFLPPVDRSRTE